MIIWAFFSHTHMAGVLSSMQEQTNKKQKKHKSYNNNC